MSKLVLTCLIGGALAALPLAAQSGANVKEAQQALKDKGVDPGPIDGIDGPKTQAAIREYQQKQNLTADGKLGPQTLDSLGVKRGTATTSFKESGTAIKHSYGGGAEDVASGSKELGHDVKDGHPVAAGKDFGKGVGAGAKKVGVGTAHAAVDAAKGVKKAFQDH